MTLGPNVESTLRSGGITERDERGLMPLAAAREHLAGKKELVRADADRTWAALCSLEDARELIEVASKLAFVHPPRGRDNVAFHERYGDGILRLLDRLVGADGSVPPNAWFVLPCLLRIGGDDAARVALRVERGGASFFGAWVEVHPEGWRFLAVRCIEGEPRALAVWRALAAADPGGVAEALDAALGAEAGAALRRAHDVGDGPASAKVRDALDAAEPSDVPRGPVLGMARIAEHFREFAYPMWDNANYFTAGMRVTGFADPERGDALVFQALATGLGEGSLRREIWRLGGAREHALRPVHTLVLLDERAIWNDDADTCLLTGVRYDAETRSHVAPEGGARTTARIPQVDRDIPLAVNTTGMKPAVAEAFAGLGGPETHLLVRISQDHRDQVFLDDAALAEVAGLSSAARPLFRFDGFQLPLAGEPPTASDDLVAMVEALRRRKRLGRLPFGGHPLAGLYDRFAVTNLGGWGDPGFLGGSRSAS